VRKKNKEKNEFSRFNALAIIMLMIFTAIISKLVNIQIINGELYRETANQKDKKIISTPAPRGEIIDRDGEKLATSKSSYILTFTNTDESDKKFFSTMDKVFKILDDNKESQVDEFLLKVNTNEAQQSTEYSFDFKTQDKASQNWTELRFKKDRGFDTNAIRDLYGDKRKGDLTPAQLKKVDEKLLEITPEEVFNDLVEQYKINEIAGFKSKSEDEIRRYMLVKDTSRMQSFSGYKPVTITNNLDKKTAFIFQQIQPEIPGISVLTQPIRVYPNKDLGSAFLGYISKINPWNTEKYEEKGYDVSTDYIGTAGIEATFEDVLRGTKGQESISVNKQGRKVKSLGEIETYPGQTIQLNIDVDMQYAAEKSLDAVMVDLQKQGKVKDVDMTNANRGAVVVLDVNTGKVLALASRPGYDPNMFAVPGRLTNKLYNSYLNPDIEKLGLDYIRKRGLTKLEGILTYKEVAEKTEKEKEQIILDYMFPIDKNIEDNTKIRRDNNDIFPKPTFNNATKSLIPPGSIFKPLTAIAGLEEGVIDETTKILDGGTNKNGDGAFNERYPSVISACWSFNDYGYGHGRIGVKEALEVSCNYFFYKVADLLFAEGGEGKKGLDLIAKYAWKFGLGVDSSGDKKPSTGIEIPESFGQVYNYESSKEILSNIYISNMINYLQEGTNRVQGKYKPLDMMPEKESGSKKEIDEIKKANSQKKVFLAYVKAEMKKIDGEYDSTNSLKKLIEASEVLKNNNYTVKDIENMAVVVNGEIKNARTEVSSAANAYNAAIGQGFNVFTPLQLANYVATIVNGGNRFETHLVDKFLDPDGNVIKEVKPVVLGKTGVSANTTRIIKEGMLDVTNNKGGTGYSVFGDFPILSGGKTGSATFNDTIQSALGRTSYGYYIGFAPYDKPEIAVCAVIFDGGHGSYVAPIAKAVYEQYFKDLILKKDPEYKFQVDPKKKTANIELNNGSVGNSPD
jgi:penicillin-binding protein 2